MVADDGAEGGISPVHQVCKGAAEHDKKSDKAIHNSGGVRGPALADDPGRRGGEGEDEDQEGDLGDEARRGEVEGLGGFGISDVPPDVELRGEKRQRQQGNEELEIPHGG